MAFGLKHGGIGFSLDFGFGLRLISWITLASAVAHKGENDLFVSKCRSFIYNVVFYTFKSVGQYALRGMCTSCHIFINKVKQTRQRLD